MIIGIKKCVIPQCEGAAHKWEFERPTVRELQRIQKVSGIDVADFVTAMDSALSGALVGGKALDGILGLVDILHRRDGLTLPWDDIDLDLGSLEFEFEDGELPEEEAEGEAGKDLAQTSRSLPPEETDGGESPGSGGESKAESPPKSAPTPPISGGGTD